MSFYVSGCLSSPFVHSFFWCKVQRLLFIVCFEDEENLILLSFQDFKMKKFSPRGKENIITSLGENLGDFNDHSRKLDLLSSI